MSKYPFKIYDVKRIHKQPQRLVNFKYGICLKEGFVSLSTASIQSRIHYIFKFLNTLKMISNTFATKKFFSVKCY